MRNDPLPQLPAIQQALSDDGYVVLKDVVSQASVAQLRAGLTTLLQAYAVEGESVFETIARLNIQDKPALYRVYQFASKTLTCMDAIRSDLMPLIEAVLPGAALPDHAVIDLGSAVIFGAPNDDRLTWQWHQEAPYDPEIQNILSVNMPVFERADQHNGSVSLLKGSHKLGPLPFDKFQESPDASTSLVPKGIEQLVEAYDEEYFVADPGDIILFFENLIHRSNRNTSDRPRVTFIGRFASISTLPEHATVIDGKPY